MIVILVLLIIAKDYLYLRKEVSQLRDQPANGEISQVEIELKIEEDIKKETEGCQANLDLSFDLEKLDFTKPIWDNELPTMLKGLLVLRAVDQNNRDLCNYEKQEINFGLRRERCERDYDFYFVLTEKLEEGIDSQQYIKECQKALLPYILIEIEEGLIEYIDRDRLNEGLEIICESYYQSFQNKAAIILDPILMCERTPAKHDLVEYLDPQTKQSKICPDEFSDEIKFLIAIAKNDSTKCSAIENFRTSLYCQFYFNRDLMTYQNKFKEIYCYDLVMYNLVEQKVVTIPE